ncbi:hypothetical protein [Azospirillum sp. ST 5-10]|uniref:hypothetical protein n=1 Tax=unclassified Azospirillum TaxID=2630922 RepID=UPI003F4A6F16
MSASVVDLSEERLIRRAPQHPLPLGPGDRDYVLACLDAVGKSFGVAAVPAAPLDTVPGRSLMRLLVDLRRTLRPGDAEQRAAHGRLTGAIHLLDTARALAEDRTAADGAGGG